MSQHQTYQNQNQNRNNYQNRGQNINSAYQNQKMNAELYKNTQKNPDELKLFFQELQTAPFSNNKNFVYRWDRGQKKFICHQEGPMKQLPNVNSFKIDGFLTDLKRQKKLVPEKDLTFLGVCFIFLAFIVLCTAAIFLFLKWELTAIILFSVGGGLFLIGLILAALSKKVQNSHLKARRTELRKFVANQNGNLFDVDNHHWTVSPRASYLIYRIQPMNQKDYTSNHTVDYPAEILMDQNQITIQQAKPQNQKFKQPQLNTRQQNFRMMQSPNQRQEKPNFRKPPISPHQNSFQGNQMRSAPQQAPVFMQNQNPEIFNDSNFFSADSNKPQNPGKENVYSFKQPQQRQKKANLMNSPQKFRQNQSKKNRDFYNDTTQPNSFLNNTQDTRSPKSKLTTSTMIGNPGGRLDLSKPSESQYSSLNPMPVNYNAPVPAREFTRTQPIGNVTLPRQKDAVSKAPYSSNYHSSKPNQPVERYTHAQKMVPTKEISSYNYPHQRQTLGKIEPTDHNPQLSKPMVLKMPVVHIKDEAIQKPYYDEPGSSPRVKYSKVNEMGDRQYLSGDKSVGDYDSGANQNPFNQAFYPSNHSNGQGTSPFDNNAYSSHRQALNQIQIPNQNRLQSFDNTGNYRSSGSINPYGVKLDISISHDPDQQVDIEVSGSDPNESFELNIRQHSNRKESNVRMNKSPSFAPNNGGNVGRNRFRNSNYTSNNFRSGSTPFR